MWGGSQKWESVVLALTTYLLAKLSSLLATRDLCLIHFVSVGHPTNQKETHTILSYNRMVASLIFWF
jgi:hypothetical protein